MHDLLVDEFRRRRPMTALGRLLCLAGAVGMALAAFLPWVTIEGILLDLDLLGTEVTAIGATVSGDDTPAWPVLLAVAALIALLAVAGRARRVLLLLGVLTIGAGGALLYYLANVIDIELSDRSAIEQAAADVAVGSSTGPGPYLLLAAGIVVSIGALGRPAARAGPG